MSNGTDEGLKKRAPIVLLTDFGNEDPYVGQMKGVIAGIAPDARIIDLCNNVPSHNIFVASAFLKGSIRFFPKGSVFAVVVDPGVGTDRKSIIVKSYDRYFVGPDNGFVTEIVEGYPRWEAVQIHNPKYMLLDISATFHGRDIFAPVAAHLWNGVSLNSIGPRLEKLTLLRIRRPEHVGGVVRGIVTHVDHFGNAWTNVSRAFLDGIGWMEDAKKIFVKVGSSEFVGLRRTYMDGESGMAMALINSFNVLEIGWAGGSAKEIMGIREGAEVEVRRM